VNFLYAHNFAGSNITSPPLTYEDTYDLLDASIVSVTYGTFRASADTATHGRNLQNKSFWAQVFGTSDYTHDYLRMTTFECTHCDGVSFFQEPQANSPAGIARRAAADAAYAKAVAEVDAVSAAYAETLKQCICAA